MYTCQFVKVYKLKKEKKTLVLSQGCLRDIFTGGC